MYKTVIAGYSRSPFTMAKKGELIDIKPVNLLAEVIKNLVSKSKINPNDIGWMFHYPQVDTQLGRSKRVFYQLLQLQEK